MRSTLVVVGTACLAVLALPATATAATEISPATTLADGGIVCGGRIVGTAIEGPSDYGPAKTVAVFLRGEFQGVDSGSAAVDCQVNTTVNWTNNTTGATGTLTQVVEGKAGGAYTNPTKYELPTGSGSVTLTVVTDRPGISGGANVTVA
mgnify:CR=1 FL=1